jgi:nickel-dependent lactate racemase
MTTMKMKYGNGYLDVTVPERNLLGVIQKDVKPEDRTEEEVILEALANPIGRPRLDELVRPGETVCIVVSDVSRAWQRMSVYLPHIVAQLNGAGIGDEDIRFLCAIGYHRPLTREEHEKLLGPALSPRFRITDHDCMDKGNLVHLGTTSRGTPATINRLAAEADHIVLTGCCTYHPWVGWGGGKKSILPGIAAFESIQHNHVMTMSGEIGGGQRPEVRNGNIVDNPVHLDMLEVADIVNPSFMFNSIIGPTGRISHAIAGHYEQAHAVGRGIVEELYGVPIDRLADIVISSQGGFPKDIEFYQTGKAIYHTQDAARPGGTMIILSECKEGLGPPDADAIFLGCETTTQREQEVRSLFTVPKYVSYYICAAADRWNIIVVSGIDPALLAKTPITVVRTVDEALRMALARHGDDAKIYLMPQGSSALPRLNG